jgi:uncharacterized membrane-anchored protein
MIKPHRILFVGLLMILSWVVGSRPAAAQGTASIADINWQIGPAVGTLGSHAQIQIPDGYRFAGRDGVRTFMELTQNPTSGTELGVVIPPAGSGESWFVIFEFNGVGYVKDDEKDKLDANGILDSMRKGTEQANEERRKRGWPTLEVVGWHTSPRYDPATNNLVWGIRGRSEGEESVNYSVRLLGRHGVMDADLVLSPSGVAETIPSFNKLLAGFEFTSGNKYAEFRAGDKIAAYGLTALVAGGAGAALAKSGVLAKLWKLIVFGLVAVGAALKKFLKSAFGRKEDVTGDLQPQ